MAPIGRMPRHAKVYRNFAAEFDQLQQERVAAFSELIADMRSGAYPENKHVVRMPETEIAAFMNKIVKADRNGQLEQAVRR